MIHYFAGVHTPIFDLEINQEIRCRFCPCSTVSSFACTFFDDKQHHDPHIHVEYGDSRAVIDILDGDILAGKLNHPNFACILRQQDEKNRKISSVPSPLRSTCPNVIANGPLTQG
ncbi:MAG: DUF4160 domain-containing protein [candidate division KSB1 bacterium]|nr:DUF4160 domain-containing protein [candidate division KSB1 bacterium]MDZ7288157.1 DUF4160 domain-containing protein [candidate division KSB1 bacterium]MDZ7300330.1 DUF4160 domain-containing protein [candidate division KSB1 bacterium]MDZ7306143.1 DUF4160 domain-containing protein [candidate division KSB1 bacterium]MDZ7351330.1 DUF4160 domain-containing protein [candidate division KSB1 bacterium]